MKICSFPFLTSCSGGRKRITDLVYNKNEHPGDNDEIGGVIFDLLCTGHDGENFLIEVQRSSQANLKQRMLYYASRLISGHGSQRETAGLGLRNYRRICDCTDGWLYLPRQFPKNAICMIFACATGKTAKFFMRTLGSFI
ncbi:MAG: PD-(D/E)XK nuclease family transposase [Mangrovibacterium sp.]